MKRTSSYLVPFAFAAMGASVLFLSGCGRDEEAAPAAAPAESPASYMSDAAFRQGLKDRNAEQRKLVSERAPLVRRMDELVREHGGDTNVLQKISEWNDLHRKVTELNARFEAGRKDLLEFTRRRIAPKKEISK